MSAGAGVGVCAGRSEGQGGRVGGESGVEQSRAEQSRAVRRAVKERGKREEGQGEREEGGE
jgi:hypothetical protein